MRSIGALFTDYGGPASVITVLSGQAAERGVSVRSVVVEVPHYPFLEMPSHPTSILKAVKSLATLLDLQVDMAPLESNARKTDEALAQLMAENEEFRELVDHLEVSYDREPSVSDEAILRRLIEGMDADGQVN